MVLELANERQEIVTSATGTPLPEAQVSAAITAQRNGEFRNRSTWSTPCARCRELLPCSQGEYGGLSSLLFAEATPMPTKWIWMVCR